jgi:superfamily II DNA or RNA helicase/HKD family nuclease
MAETKLPQEEPCEFKILDWTNENGKFCHVLSEGIKECKQLDILVGFFYINGIEFNEVKEALNNNNDIKIRILVGMKAGSCTKELVDYIQTSYPMDGFENNPGNDRLAELFKKVKKGNLIVKKTREQNHSKLYIFNQNQTDDSFHLIGSSNLSQAGIADRQELNAQVRQSKLQKQVQKLFDELWEDARPFTVADFTDKYDGGEPIRAEETQPLEISPFDAYVWLMQRYLNLYLPEQTDVRKRIEEIVKETNKFSCLTYQVDAVIRALEILKEYKGVLIADVVGLGKSVIASIIAKYSNKGGIVLCPPHLTSDWNGYYDDEGRYVKGYFNHFNLKETWQAFSMYRLDEVEAYCNKAPEAFGMVIIDEAHRFRNIERDGYNRIHQLCKRFKEVVLLTATPFNNRPLDIYALLSLFPIAPITEREHSVLEEKLKNQDISYQDTVAKLKAGSDFTYAERIKAKIELDSIAEKVRLIMINGTVRRNRIDIERNQEYLDNLQKEGKSFSKQHLADPQTYDLDEGQMHFFDWTVDEVFGNKEGNDPLFKGAAYTPTKYLTSNKANDEQGRIIANQQERNLYGMKCRFLVNRLESSFAAFQKSVEKMRDFHNKTLADLKNGQINFDRKQQEDETPEEDVVPTWERKSSKTELKLYIATDFGKDFRDDVEIDRNLLNDVLSEINRLQLIENDPKRQTLINDITQILENGRKDIEPEKEKRRIVVFSVYSDTVMHLWNGLITNPKFGEQRVKRMIGAEKNEDSVEEIKKWFDASIGDTPPSDCPDVLVTTDALSEGLNLNRAGLIINYDIPWNPTRVIQRVGRINRIGKKVFDKIYVFNYFPTAKGETITNKMVIAGSKARMIHRIVCEDAMILDGKVEDKMPTQSDFLNQVNSTNIEKEEETISDYTNIHNLFIACKSLFKEIDLKQRFDLLERNTTTRMAIRGNADKDNLIVFRSDGVNIRASLVDDSIPGYEKLTDINIKQAFKLIECIPDTKAIPFDPAWSVKCEKAINRPIVMKRKNKGDLKQRALTAIAPEQKWVDLENLPEDLQKKRAEIEEAIKDGSLFSKKLLKPIARIESKRAFKNLLRKWKPRQTGLNKRSEPIVLMTFAAINKSNNLKV